MNFNKILKDIKEVKIQGAESVAIAGLKVLKEKYDKKTIHKLLSLRKTEPCLRNVIKFIKKDPKNLISVAMKHFKEADIASDEIGSKIIKKNSVVFVHCHSSSVVGILKKARKKKKFEVFNTETRPLFQGRKTARELGKAKIKVTNFVDAAAGIALRKTSGTKKSDLMLIGCDAILKDGSVINKVGSGMFAEIAYGHNIPVYIATDSWKFSNKKVEIEMRDFNEVWKGAHKNVKVKNPAFEKVEAKHVKAIISELGILRPKEFVKRVKKVYPWIK